MITAIIHSQQRNEWRKIQGTTRIFIQRYKVGHSTFSSTVSTLARRFLPDYSIFSSLQGTHLLWQSLIIQAPGNCWWRRAWRKQLLKACSLLKSGCRRRKGDQDNFKTFPKSINLCVVTIVERYKIGFNTLFSFFLLSVYTFDQVDHKLPPSAWHVSSKSVCSLYRSCSNTLPLRVTIFTWDGGTERWWWWWKADSDWVFWAISDQRTHQQFVSRVCVYVKEPVWSRHDICKSPRPFVSDFQLRDKMSCSFLRRILFLPGYHHHTNVYQMLEHFLWHHN